MRMCVYMCVRHYKYVSYTHTHIHIHIYTHIHLTYVLYVCASCVHTGLTMAALRVGRRSIYSIYTMYSLCDRTRDVNKLIT